MLIITDLPAKIPFLGLHNYLTYWLSTALGPLWILHWSNPFFLNATLNSACVCSSNIKQDVRMATVSSINLFLLFLHWYICLFVFLSCLFLMKVFIMNPTNVPPDFMLPTSEQHARPMFIASEYNRLFCIRFRFHARFQACLTFKSLPFVWWGGPLTGQFLFLGFFFFYLSTIFYCLSLYFNTSLYSFVLN